MDFSSTFADIYLAGWADAHDCHDIDTPDENERCTNYIKERK